MKVNRYKYGRSNVSMLESQRAGLVSPEKMAAGTAAPYVAAADIAGEAADTINVFNQKKKQAQAKTAATDVGLQVAYATNAIESLPEVAKREGWTREQLEQEGKNILSAFEDSINAIDPEYREEVRSSFNMNRALFAQQIANTSLDYEEHLRLQKMKAGWLTAKEANDPIQMQFFLDIGKEIGDITPEEEVQMRSEIKVTEDRNLVESLYEEWRTSDNPDAVYSRIVNAGDVDTDVRDAAIKRIEGEINNQESFDKQRVKVAVIDFEREVTDMMMLAKQNKLSLDMVDDLVARADAYGSDIMTAKATGWRNKLYLATLEGTSKAVDNSVFARRLRGGPGTINPTAENRKKLQAYMDEIVTENTTEDEKILIENNLTKVAGFPPESVHQSLKAAGSGKNAGPLVKAAIRVLEITDNDVDTGVELDLDERESANIMRVANAIRLGNDPTEVAQQVVETTKKWEQDEIVVTGLNNQARSIIAKKRSNAVEDAFKTMVDKHFNAIDFPWTDAEMTEGEENTAYIRFKDYFMQAYRLTDGDEQAALDSAVMQFRNDHALTYINGEAEIQYGGRAAGSEELGNALFESDLLGKEFIAMDDSGSSVVTIEDRDKIKFRNPRIVDGVQEYRVFYDERPMFSDDEKYRRRSVYVRVDEAAELALQDATDAETIQSIRDEISDLEADLREAERMNKNIYVKGEMNEKIRDIPKEILRLQKRIRKIEG